MKRILSTFAFCVLLGYAAALTVQAQQATLLDTQAFHAADSVTPQDTFFIQSDGLPLELLTKQPTQFVVAAGTGEELLTIHLTDGTVDWHGDQAEAVQAFWRLIESQIPACVVSGVTR